MSKGIKIFLRILLPMVVLGVALLIAFVMIENRPRPGRSVVGETETPVRIAVATDHGDPVTIHAAGTVIAEESVQLKPQVNGEITWMSPNLVPGGFFEKGDVILRIDRRDYELILAQRKGELAQAEFELTNERGLAAIAREEWSLLGDEVKATEEGRALTLRKPQLARAEARLAAAKSAVDKAELDLARTEIRAPFNAMVGMESADLGQLVNSQTVIATLTGTDDYWVQTSVAVEDLAHLALPDVHGRGGARARVRMRSGEVTVTREGRLVRLLGDLEEAGRMARVLVEINDPLGRQLEGLPLLLRAYVDVEIVGRAFADVVAIPAPSLREGNKVWVVDPDSRLEIRVVEVAWETEERVLVRKGLRKGEHVVTSRIPAPIPGMKLKEAENGRSDALSMDAGGVR